MSAADRDPLTIAREVLDDELGWEAKPSDAMRREDVEAVYRLANAAPALARTVAAVADLHEPVTVYDECEDETCHDTHLYMHDYPVCENSAIGWACAVCCFDGDHPLECRDHHGDHRGVTQAEACATTKALHGETHG